MANKGLAEGVDRLYEQSPLPEVPDRNKLNQLLIPLREDFYVNRIVMQVPVLQSYSIKDIMNICYAAGQGSLFRPGISL